MKESRSCNNEHYVITKDFKLVSYNTAVIEACGTISLGDKCHKAIMKSDTPCAYCPVKNGLSSVCPIYYDSKQDMWKEIVACETSDGNYAISEVSARDMHKTLFESLTDAELDSIKKRSMGTPANDLFTEAVSQKSSIIYANKQMFFAIYILDIAEDRFSQVSSIGWISEIIGKSVKASKALERITTQLIMPDSKNKMKAFNDITTMSERIGKKNLICEDYTSITGDKARAIIVPLERDSNGKVTKVFYASRYLQYEPGALELDSLTGLYTRNSFARPAGEWLSAHPFSAVNILIADVKNFKLVNSAYGEAKGDELLISMAEFFKSHFENGICARYGSDQIVCMFSSTQKYEHEWYEDLMLEFSENAPLPYIALKAGVYRNVDRSISVIGMCDRALMALKSIKDSYGMSVAFYDGQFSQERIKTENFESKFIDAIKKHEFKVWYQPKYNPYTNVLSGAEALVRWEPKDGSRISPGEFMPIFEKDGLINILDEYMFTSVCEQIEKWKKKGKSIVPVSVNLSRSSMHNMDIVRRYKMIAEDYGADPVYVPIEITESAAVGNVEIKPLADAFYAAGFTLHMDDFGSEHSSLNGLSLLHLSVVKFDKSLIDGIGTEQGNLVLEYTMALAKSLGLNIVAEGVEDEAQVTFLKRNRVDYIQGYYYSKPLPVDEFEKLL